MRLGTIISGVLLTATAVHAPDEPHATQNAAPEVREEAVPMSEQFRCIAHRGNGKGKDREENSLYAVEAAIQRGAQWLEVDVRLSKDGVPVILHDRTLDRTTTGKGNVSEYTSGELRGFRTKKRKQQIPTLEELLSGVAGRAGLVLDIKDRIDPIELSAQLESYLEQYETTYERLLVSSYDLRWLSELRRVSPNVPIAALVQGVPIAFEPLLDQLKPDVIQMSVDFLDPQLIDAARERGVPVHLYTVNTLADLERGLALGAQGIITDKQRGICAKALQ